MSLMLQDRWESAADMDLFTDAAQWNSWFWSIPQRGLDNGCMVTGATLKLHSVERTVCSGSSRSNMGQQLAEDEDNSTL